ncbi:hypothetical protein EW146_g9772 [Bondarzewia mesenterica]|uniref:CCD97-like C-terminal domain-containing protein n=1 Tax=Bondarzewia mesenterica TaxID=1095465 RepID=A0A4S4L4V8_9AGAM|nr:hypothetical protein EW146_g9772 [Bondarzewia mesenterica]
MSSSHEFNQTPILSWLGLKSDFEPAPSRAPIEFLTQHFSKLPPHLLKHFSAITTPRQRSLISAIRNRRFRFASTDPLELRFSAARSQWPTLWDGRGERYGGEEAREEKEWVEHEFLGGSMRPHVGKLGVLLGDYEEEREAERVRTIRRQHAAEDFVPEEDESDEEEEEEEEEGEAGATPMGENESVEDSQALFQRRIRERFIYGLLETDLYETVDWEEKWDDDDRDAEDRWFEEEEES